MPKTALPVYRDTDTLTDEHVDWCPCETCRIERGVCPLENQRLKPTGAAHSDRLLAARLSLRSER